MKPIYYTLAKETSTNEFKKYFCRTFNFMKNKHFEIDCNYYDYFWIELTLEFDWTGHDHAGTRFELGLFGYYLSLMIYDNRHWDYETNNWVD